MLEAVAKGL